MGLPKRRHSNTRTRLRRAHDHIKKVSVGVCSNCGTAVMPHRICPHCGFYKGRQVVQVKAEETTGESK